MQAGCETSALHPAGRLCSIAQLNRAARSLRNWWQVAEKLRISGEIGEKRPSGAKANADFAAFAARLKPCPFKTSTYSEVP
jgi:hypothetical protein